MARKKTKIGKPICTKCYGVGCSNCNGRGYLMESETDKCKKCEGKGIIYRKNGNVLACDCKEYVEAEPKIKSPCILERITEVKAYKGSNELQYKTREEAIEAEVAQEIMKMINKETDEEVNLTPGDCVDWIMNNRKDLMTLLGILKGK